VDHLCKILVRLEKSLFSKLSSLSALDPDGDSVSTTRENNGLLDFLKDLLNVFTNFFNMILSRGESVQEVASLLCLDLFPEETRKHWH